MENNLELQKFDKAKADLTKLVDGYKDLKIKDVNDDSGYETVKRAKNELVTERGILERLGKSMRDNFTKVNREIMKIQKDVVGIVEPLELELKGKLKAIDNGKIRFRRMNYLESKKDSLKEIELELSDEEILKFSDGDFLDFFAEQKILYLEAKQKKIDDLRLEVEREKERKAFEKQAKIDAEIKAKQDLIDKQKFEEDKELAEKEDLERDSA